MKTIWLVAGDRSEITIYETGPYYHNLKIVDQIRCEDARLPTKKFRNDKQGRLFEHFSTYRHSAGVLHKENKDLMDQLAKRVVKKVEKGRVGGKFDGLFIMAPSKLLGSIMKKMDTCSRKMIINQFSKNPKDMAKERLIKHMRLSLSDHQLGANWVS